MTKLVLCHADMTQRAIALLAGLLATASCQQPLLTAEIENVRWTALDYGDQEASFEIQNLSDEALCVEQSWRSGQSDLLIGEVRITTMSDDPMPLNGDPEWAFDMPGLPVPTPRPPLVMKIEPGAIVEGRAFILGDSITVRDGEGYLVRIVVDAYACTNESRDIRVESSPT